MVIPALPASLDFRVRRVLLEHPVFLERLA